MIHPNTGRKDHYLAAHHYPKAPIFSPKNQRSVFKKLDLPLYFPRASPAPPV